MEVPRDLRPPKTFDDASQYNLEIPLLVPGYELMHALIPHLTRSLLRKEQARILVVGCGTGKELVTLGTQNPRWYIDALEPSESMAQAAQERVIEQKLKTRVLVHATSLDAYRAKHRYDLVVSLLVGHLIPDKGARLDFFETIAHLLKRDAHLILTEFTDASPLHNSLTHAHVAMATHLGLPASRAEQLRQRIGSDFHLVTVHRRDALAALAGFTWSGDFFRVLTLVGSVYKIKQPNGN